MVAAGLAPFYQCAFLYVLVLVLAVCSWVFWHEPLRRAAFWLAVVVAAAHTLALSLRVYLMGRLALTGASRRTLTGIIYGSGCFVTLWSFVGTVPGGIWADQSWGRFWGWDPKENGALLLVVMNALVLHARWGGMIRERGLALLAITGNMVTAWSWFGTNQLGVGLHAYGFNDGLAQGCALFWVSQVVLLGLGAMPARFWRLNREMGGEQAGPVSAAA